MPKLSTSISSAPPPLKPTNYGTGGQSSTATVAAPQPQGLPAYDTSFKIGQAPSSIHPTSTGGMSFDPSKISPTIGAQPFQQPSTSKPPLSSFMINSYKTPNGGDISLGGDGSVKNFTPSSGYSIDTSGPHASDTMNSHANLQQAHSAYSDLVNGVAQAQGYSPQYLQALNQQYSAQAQGAQLGLNQAGINSALVSRGAPTTQDYLSNPNAYKGDTMGYTQALNAQEQTTNSMAQGVNAVQQLAANQALGTQQLARTGAISSAQTQLQYSPAGISGQNALQQANSLQQAHPDAGIVPYAQSGMTPEQYQQYAMQKVAQSPSYQSQFQSTYSLPGGGTGIRSSLNTGALQHNPDGTITLVSGAAASLGDAQRSSLNQNLQTYNTLQPAFKAANDDFTAMNSFMQQAGINDQSLPIINQLENKVKAGGIDPGAVGAFKSYIASLRANYANLLGTRGETPSMAGSQATELIPDNLNVSNMAQIQEALNTNGQNILNATGAQIKQITDSLGNGSSGVTPQGAQGTQAPNVANSWNF